MRRSIIAVSVMVATLGAGIALATAERPDATVHFTGGSVAAGLGYTWGEGTIDYKGKVHHFTVNGLSAGDLGASKIEATGEVFGLNSLEDFEGTYGAVTAGATAGAGGGATEMKNANGVTITAKANTEGAKLKLGVDGVKISLKD